MSTPSLRVALSAGYGSHTVLDDLRFTLDAGQALGFIGSSGTGKSTLALAAMGLLAWRGGWVRGEVSIEGVDLLRLNERAARTLRGRRIALVPQSPLSALNAAITLQSHFHESWRAHDGGGPAALQSRLSELFAQLQLPVDRTFLSRRPGAISVGQAQRVLIALALLHRPAVIIADEPTSALDPVTQAELLNLLRRLRDSTQAALLYISHDLLSVLQLCDQVAVLDCGRLVDRLAVAELTIPNRRSQSYSMALRSFLDALPVAPEHVRSLPAIAQNSAGPPGVRPEKGSSPTTFVCEQNLIPGRS